VFIILVRIKFAALLIEILKFVLISTIKIVALGQQSYKVANIIILQNNGHLY